MDLSQILPTTVEWWQVLIAVVVVIAGWILSRLARKAVISLLKRAPSVTAIVSTIIARAVSYTILLLSVAVALAVLGVNMQPLLAIAVVLAVVAVLVLRGVADNFAAGVVIQATRPVVVGDEVQVEGVDGKPLTGVVTDLNSRTVILQTYDGRTVHIPNARMVQEPIVNHSTRGLRRGEVQVRVELAERGVDEVLAVLSGAAAGAEGVDDREPTRALATAVSTERLSARVLYWHAPTDGLTITDRVVRAVSDALAAAGAHGAVTSDPVVPPLVPSESI